MNQPSDGEISWEEVSPHLDAALGDLADADRDAVLLRYFENKSAQEIAILLGTSAEAARKRVRRAVEKLRENLAGRGITAGCAGLTTVISANAVQAAPAGLAATFSIAALAGSSATVTATQVLAMTTLQKSLVAIVVTALAGFGIYQTKRVSELEEQVRASRSEDAPLVVTERQPQEASDRNPAGLARNNQRLVGRKNDLEQKNDALEEESARTKAALDMTMQQAEFLGDIAMKFASGDEIHVPESLPELAVLYGQAKRRARDFYQKWDGRIPAGDAPDAAEYQKELDACVTDDATLLKAFQTVDGSLDDPQGRREFQSMQLYGALDLDEAAYGRVCQVVERFYTDSDYHKLSSRFRPETGVEAWEEKRNDAGRKVIAELRSCLTPRQQADFDRLYTPEFLWGLNVGGQRPK